MSTVTNWQKQILTIPGKSIQNIYFTSPLPNYFRITNNGDSSIFLGVANIPSDKNYEMKIPASASEMYAEQTPHDQIYVYNSSLNDANLIIISFNAEFDPTALALTGNSVITAGKDNPIMSETEITAFSAQLPAGSNLIGSININDPIPAGTNKIGSIDINNSIPAGSNTIGSVGVVASADLGNYFTSILNQLKKIPTLKIYTSSAPYTHYLPDNGMTINKIALLSNDSSSVTLTAVINTDTIVLQPGEAITDISAGITSIGITATDTYRLIYTEV